MESNKQVVVGLDGATFDLIEPWVEEGKLPHFEKFMWQGSWGELETTYPPLTAPAWSSFMTGCNPGKHGIYDFLSSDPSSDEVVDYTSIEPPTLWDLFSQNNRKVGLVNLPVTYPPPDVNGHVISGLLSSNDRDESAYPPGLIQELEQKTGRTWWPEVRDSAAPSNPLEFLDAQLEANETIAQFSLTLLEEYDYDFFMCMLDATDFIAHFFWHYMEEDHPYYEDRGQRYENAVLSAYQQVDSFLERLDEQVGENTDVMIMSDHGFGRIEKMVNLNNFFEERDYLVQKKTPMTLLKRGMRAIGLHPSRVMKIVEALGLDNLVFLVHKSIRNKIIGSMGSFSDINWDKTVCYSRGHIGQVYLTDRIKQRPDQYSAKRQEIADTLKSELVDPETGEPVVTDLFFKEDLWEGPYLDEAPDIFLVMEDWKYIAYPLFSSGPELFFRHIQNNRYANHRMNGVFFGRGPSFQSTDDVEGASIVDVAPTLLYLSGLEVSEYMDGDVLEQFLSEGLLEEHPPESKEYELELPEHLREKAEQDEDVKERLQGLGYLG